MSCLYCSHCQFPRSSDDNNGLCKCIAMKRKTIDVYVCGGETPEWCPLPKKGSIPKPKQAIRIAEREQHVAAEILTAFMFTNTMDDVKRVWNSIYDTYELFDDPFTLCPCSPKEYEENRLEYDKQAMIERYGHCDGLEE